jgi:hypothetical protein
MISQLHLRASGNKTLEDVISQMQLSPALRRYRQAVCPGQKLRPVDNVSRAYRQSSRTRSQAAAAALMLHSPRWPASPRAMPLISTETCQEMPMSTEFDASDEVATESAGQTNPSEL